MVNFFVLGAQIVVCFQHFEYFLLKSFRVKPKLLLQGPGIIKDQIFFKDFNDEYWNHGINKSKIKLTIMHEAYKQWEHIKSVVEKN